MQFLKKIAEALFVDLLLQGVKSLIVSGGVLAIVVAFVHDISNIDWPWTALLALSFVSLGGLLWAIRQIYDRGTAKLARPVIVKSVIREWLDEQHYTTTIFSQEPVKLKTCLKGQPEIYIWHNRGLGLLNFESVGLKPGNHLREMVDGMNQREIDDFVTRLRIDLLKLGLEFEQSPMPEFLITLRNAVPATKSLMRNRQDFFQHMSRVLLGANLVHMLYQKEYLDRHGVPEFAQSPQHA